MRSLMTAAAAVLAGATIAAAQPNIIFNPGFEEICGPAVGWTTFGNVENINFFVSSGNRSIKMFGPFNGPVGYSGIFQDVPAQAGQRWRAAANVFNPCWDAFRPNGTKGFVSVDFYDAQGNLLNPAQANISLKQENPTPPGGASSCSPGCLDLDNGTECPGGQPDPQLVRLETAFAEAPAGTVTARISLLVEQLDFVGGAGWYDDAELVLESDPSTNVLANPSFEQRFPRCDNSAFQGWTNFGNGQANFGEIPRNGNYAAKLFGGFNGNPAFSGWFQNNPALEGSRWQGKGWARTQVTDLISADNRVFLGIEFFDEFGANLLGSVGTVDFPTGGVNSPGNLSYQEFTTQVVEAPPGTASVRLLILQIQSNFAGGATWWDDMSLVQIGGCRADINGDGNLDPDDLSDFIAAYFSTPPGAGTDYNGDGNVDPDDLSDYISEFFAGC